MLAGSHVALGSREDHPSIDRHFCRYDRGAGLGVDAGAHSVAEAALVGGLVISGTGLF